MKFDQLVWRPAVDMADGSVSISERHSLRLTEEWTLKLVSEITAELRAKFFPTETYVPMMSLLGELNRLKTLVQRLEAPSAPLWVEQREFEPFSTGVNYGELLQRMTDEAIARELGLGYERMPVGSEAGMGAPPGSGRGDEPQRVEAPQLRDGVKPAIAGLTTQAGERKVWGA